MSRWQAQLLRCFMAKKNPSLAVGRGEKLSVAKGAGLTTKGRACELCGVDISAKRSNARFCCRAHKTKVSDALRNYANEYQKNKTTRQKQALKYYYADHEKSKAVMRDRQKDNLPAFAANEAKRRSIKTQRTPEWLTVDDIWIINQAYELAALRTKMFGFKWHVDHIVPLKGNLVSGLHVPWNLQVIPAHENISKHNKFEVA